MKTRRPDLDDIGFIGDGRPMTEDETRMASAHIQAYKAKHKASKRKAKARPKAKV